MCLTLSIHRPCHAPLNPTPPHPPQPSNVRTNAAGVLVQMTGGHESYRAAIAAAGGVGALAGGLLRGPDAPACNAALALYNMAALTPPNLRPAMAAREGPMAVRAGSGAGGARDKGQRLGVKGQERIALGHDTSRSTCV